jgi:hypothetical protein
MPSATKSVSKPRKRTTAKKTAPLAVKETKLIPEQYDNAKSLAIAGLIGIILTYIIGSRALNTGSYWQYLLTLILLIVSIRIFIRSIKRK